MGDLLDLTFIAGTLIRKRDSNRVTFVDFDDPVLFEDATRTGDGTAITVPVAADRYLLVVGVGATTEASSVDAVIELQIDGQRRHRFGVTDTGSERTGFQVPILADPGETVTVEVVDVSPPPRDVDVWVAGLWGIIL